MQTLPAHVGIVRSAELEFKLAKKVMGRMKSFCKYTASKRKTKWVSSLFSEAQNLVTRNREKAEVVCAFFCISFHW